MGSACSSSLFVLLVSWPTRQSTVVKAAKAAKAKAAAKVAGARAAHLERIEQHAQWMAGGPRTLHSCEADAFMYPTGSW